MEEKITYTKEEIIKAFRSVKNEKKVGKGGETYHDGIDTGHNFCIESLCNELDIEYELEV